MSNKEIFLFEWDGKKEIENIKKHGVSFSEAQNAFNDPSRLIAIDDKHSDNEPRMFCIGKTHKGILTVRFVYKEKIIRIFGAGYWRKGSRFYYEENNIR